MTFWGRSGSSDPCFWLIDPDPDPAIFVIDLQDASKKQIFNRIISAYYVLKVHLHHFSKIKSQKESQNRRNQGYSYYFCMMIEGSGSIPLTSGSGSGSRRPKNKWIRWIRIWIRNTGSHKTVWLKVFYYFCLLIEGYGSGSITLANGSGSGRPKNMSIRWIRIRNTVCKSLILHGQRE